MTVKGTCTTLEKEYLRLTAPPRPELVRPQNILEQHLESLKKYYSRPNRKEYLWFCSQLKAIRQDCTVQRLQNEFAVDVYETHARIALREGTHESINTQYRLLEIKIQFCFFPRMCRWFEWIQSVSDTASGIVSRKQLYSESGRIYCLQAFILCCFVMQWPVRWWFCRHVQNYVVTHEWSTPSPCHCTRAQGPGSNGVWGLSILFSSAQLHAKCRTSTDLIDCAHHATTRAETYGQSVPSNYGSTGLYPTTRFRLGRRRQTMADSLRVRNRWTHDLDAR